MFSYWANAKDALDVSQIINRDLNECIKKYSFNNNLGKRHI